MHSAVMQTQGSFHDQYLTQAHNPYAYHTPSRVSNPLLNVSYVSQGGITSVKSHGRAIGNEPVQSKAHSSGDEEPVDPGYDDLEDDQGRGSHARLGPREH